MKYTGLLKIYDSKKKKKWFVYTTRIEHLGATKHDRMDNSEGKRGLNIFRVGFHNVAYVFYFETQLLFIFRGITITAQKNPLRISSVNVTKSAVSWGFGHIYWRNPWWETSFFVHYISIYDTLDETIIYSFFQW